MLSNYPIEPVNKRLIKQLKDASTSKRALAWVCDFYSGEETNLGNYKLAILGVKEDRLFEKNAGCNDPDKIREEFYKLIKPRQDIKLIDLGNIEMGNEVSDTYFALKQILQHLIKNDITTLILGGIADLAYAQYTAYEEKHSNLNLLICDAKVEMRIDEENQFRSGYVSRIIQHQPYYLFNIAHMGHQSYFVEPESYDAFERMNFDMLRLGVLRHKIQDMEPFCRNANMMAFNLSCIRAGEAPGQNNPSPSGFNGEEACQISRYAGMSSDISSAGFYGFNPANDKQSQTAQLMAQMIWYFLDGFTNRKNEYPTGESKDYVIYRTTFRNSQHEIVFYKNVLSNRWWMEVPFPKERSKQEGKFMVPCSYSDYQMALNDEIPDRWVKAFHKL